MDEICYQNISDPITVPISDPILKPVSDPMLDPTSDPISDMMRALYAVVSSCVRANLGPTALRRAGDAAALAAR